MKALMLKEFYGILNCWPLYLFLIALSVLTFTGNLFYWTLPAFIPAAITVVSFADDNKSKWSVYRGCFPYTKAQSISAKWVTSLIFEIVFVIFISVLWMIRLCLNESFHFSLFWEFVLLTLALSLILPAICIFFASKSKKLQYAFITTFFFVGMLSGFMAGFYKGLFENAEKTTHLSIRTWVIVLFAIAVLIYAFFWILSIHTDKKGRTDRVL